MIFGIGTDLVDVENLIKQLNNNNSLVEQFFTAAEIHYCESRSSREQNFAARLAAKESFFKALSVDLQGNLPFTEVEISNEENGRPLIYVSGSVREMLSKLKIKQIHLSMTHIKSLASAIVILEK